MNDIYIGKIVNTHGLLGEVRIISKFAYKESVFQKNVPIYIGSKRRKHLILSYRKHKMYDMVFLDGVDSIEKAELYKGMDVYAKREDLNVDGYYDEDLLGLHVYVKETDKGEIIDILENGAHKILVVGKRRYMIPYVDSFIEKIDLENRRIDIIEMEGLFNED